MYPALLVTRLLLFAWVGAGLTVAQVALKSATEKLANRILDGAVTGEKLSCVAMPWRPFFDFSLRFEMGYVVRCPYRQFNGGANHLFAIARVRPVGGNPILLGEVYGVPALPENVRSQVTIRKFKGDLEFSGAIAVGEGEYQIELLVADDQSRYFLKKWKVRTQRHGAEKRAEISLQPNEVAPLVLANTASRDTSRNKPLRVTVLLDAMPINPFSRKLRAWDRAFLLGSVVSLMRQVPSASLRLVAFNIDQQKELFRAVNLDGESLPQLGDALRQLELGTVSYRTLQQSGGWANLLTQMLGSESASADAVVFLGPQIRLYARIPRESLSCRADSTPRLFYLKYLAFGAPDFPDPIDHITKDCKGRVLGFHTPGELGAAIRKMREMLPPAR